MTFLFLCAILTAADWPTYRHDYQRSGGTEARLRLPLTEVWRFEAAVPPMPAWPPPAKQDFWHHKVDLPARVIYDRAFHVVSDGESVYFGSSSDDQVRALDLRTGEKRWSFFCEGPVRLAPTVVSERLYFGSDDGSVYCVSAKTGELSWRHDAAADDRRIPGNGRLISVWPVRGSVVVEGGQVRFASGLFPLQGTFQHVLDATDGKLLAKAPLDFSPQGYLQLRGGRLRIPRGRAKATFLDGKSGFDPPRQVDAPPKDYPFSLIRAGSMRLVGGEGRVAALAADDSVSWSGPVVGRAYSLAVAGGSLLVSTDRGVVHCFRPAGDYRDGVRRPAVVTDRRGPQAVDERRAGRARRMLRIGGVDRGYGLVLGKGSGALAGEIARQSRLRLVAAPPDSLEVARQRVRLSEQGLYGRVALHHVPGSRLPYGSGLFNLVVVTVSPDQPDPRLPAGEIARLLRPGGGVAVVTAVDSGGVPREPALEAWADWPGRDGFVVTSGVDWLRIERGSLGNAGRWTHMYAEPDNRACSNDRLVADRLKLQWFGAPGPREMVDRHHRTVPPLFADGRLFVPGNDRIFAVDAYNGSPLWQAELASFRRVGAMRDSGSMAASVEYLYAVAGDRCYGIDTETGNFELNFAVPTAADQHPREWGYVAYVGDLLYGSTTRRGASRGQHSRQQIGETYFDFVPIVTSDGLFCVDRRSGESQWQYRPTRGAILNPTITIADGRIFFVESGNRETLLEASGRSTLEALLGRRADLVAMDARTGQPLWRVPVDLSSIQHHLYLCHADGKLIAVGSKNKEGDRRVTVWYDLHAYDARDGTISWSATQDQGQGVNGDHGEQDHHPVIVNGVVYQEPFAYDIASGERLEGWEFRRGGHGCGTVSASASTLFFRAGNPTMRNLESGGNQKVTTVSRPGCWINMIPAGGLLLIPEASSGCTCEFPIQSSMALIAESLATGSVQD